MKLLTYQLLVIAFLFVSCSQNDESGIYLENLEVSMPENASKHSIIGKLRHSYFNSHPNFEVIHQNIQNAIYVDDRGFVRVHNSQSFNYEQNSQILATVSMTPQNSDETVEASITINIQDTEIEGLEDVNTISSSRWESDFGRFLDVSEDGNTMMLSYRPNSHQIQIYNKNDESWTLMDEINGPSEGTGFQKSCALSKNGKVLLIGFPNRTSSDDLYGEVKIYVKEASNWVNKQTLKGKEIGDNFGTSVALNHDGTRLAVGASLVSENDENKTIQYVSIYELENNNWTSVAKIESDTPTVIFSWHLTMDYEGNMIVVSGDVATDTYSGRNNHIFTYVYNGDNWNALGKPISARGLGFNGVSLDKNGETLVVGRYDAYSSTGRTNIYKRNNTKWQEVDILSFNNTHKESMPTESSDYFGYHTKINPAGNLIIVQSVLDLKRCGISFYIKMNDGTWSQILDNNYGKGIANDGFGIGLDIVGDDYIVVGAPSLSFNASSPAPILSNGYVKTFKILK